MAGPTQFPDHLRPENWPVDHSQLSKVNQDFMQDFSEQIAAAEKELEETDAFQEEKWKQFVEDSGLEKTKTYPYYLGNKQKKNPMDMGTATNLKYPSYTNIAHEKILNGLLADAIEVGTINLPAQYLAEDFELKIKSVSGGDNVFDLREAIIETVFVSDTKNFKTPPELNTSGYEFRYCVERQENDYTMSDDTVCHYLGQIAKAINALLGPK